MGSPAPQPLYILESQSARRRIAVAMPRRARTFAALLIFVLPAAVFAGLACWTLRTQDGRPKRNGRPKLRIGT
jgi:hypothetical protein